MLGGEHRTGLPVRASKGAGEPHFSWDIKQTVRNKLQSGRIDTRLMLVRLRVVEDSGRKHERCD